MQQWLQRILAWLATVILARYQPRIVAVAGSVGKTSTTRAVAASLDRELSVRATPKNFNNEIGVPLTILGAVRTGGRSPFAWTAILWHGFRLAFGPARPYPHVLVLEMGTDHPGDMAYLTTLAPPDVAVVTAVAEEHTEFLGDLEGVAKEEGQVVRALGEEGIAVLNADDPRVAEMREHAPRSIMYGFGERADVRARNVAFETAHGTVFTRFELVIDGEPQHVTLSDAVGHGNVYAALAAAAAARACGIDAALIPYALAAYQPPAGRLRVLPGIKGSTLIDDTYNASPRAVALAIETFEALARGRAGRRAVALGDMLELGKLSADAHAAAGKLAAEARPDLLIGVGPESVRLCEEAVTAGLPADAVRHFADSVQAGRFLQGWIGADDLLLIKGSQGIRMEKIVKELMAEPERARELLVRQDPPWNQR